MESQDKVVAAMAELVENLEVQLDKEEKEEGIKSCVDCNVEKVMKEDEITVNEQEKEPNININTLTGDNNKLCQNEDNIQDIISTNEENVNDLSSKKDEPKNLEEDDHQEREEQQEFQETINNCIVVTGSQGAEPDAETEFFERFSSIRVQYESSERKTIQEFQFQPDDATDGQNPEDELLESVGGFNVEDLYGEILYSILHTLHSEEQPEISSLISHLQQVFHVDNDKHQRLLEGAKNKKALPLILNLEVIEAKGLHGKDVNGLSDPFCTLYISPKQKHTTSMKPETLTPVWREYFSFPVTSTEDEILTVEVWDYDPEESLSIKMKRFGEVKSTRGLKVLMKEIAMTTSPPKEQHDFLGWLRLPLKKIPTEGLDKWFPLEGKNGNGGGKKHKGEILLKMSVGTEKDKQVASQEYRHALHLLLVHELDEENVSPFQWSGQFINKYSDYVLRQIQWQGGLRASHLDMSKWIVYSRVQCEHPLNPKVYPNLVANIVHYLENRLISDDEIRKFWLAAEKLVDHFANFLRTIHQCFLNNTNVNAHAFNMLKTIGIIKHYFETRKVTYPELESKINATYITEKFENVISRGANELFMSISKTDAKETPVENMTRLGQLLTADLKLGLETAKQFKELIGVDYMDITYRVYDEKYCELVKPVIDDFCKNMKRIDVHEYESNGGPGEEELSGGTVLFGLYLAIRQFSEESHNLASQNDLFIHGTFHDWFYSNVANWLDIAFFKAMKRIRRAVQLDDLKQMDQYIPRSSSASDTATIFTQIQTFWNQLAWPDVEGSYTFIAKILDDLCRCIIFYGEIMCRKVEELEKRQKKGDKYEISDELCCAINNIEFVGSAMTSICEKLNTQKILNELTQLKGDLIGAQCKRTLETVMEDANENINNKILEILENIGFKLQQPIARLLKDGAETRNGEQGLEKLLRYLDTNLVKIKNKTTQTSFDKLFNIIWENAAVALNDLVRTNIDKRRPSTFFKQSHNMLLEMLSLFYPDEEQMSDIISKDKIKSLIYLLEIHGATTQELILKYQVGRHDEQIKILPKSAENGLLTFRINYCEDNNSLRIEILNARNLKPADSNGFCDPFVKIRVVPEEVYLTSPKHRTKIQKKTLFPLFDETFTIELSSQEMAQGGLIRFTLKDHDLLGRNDFLGDVYFPLISIPFTTTDLPLKDLPQQNAVLTKPSESEWASVILRTLENRHWDKMAVGFVKKERKKMEKIPSPATSNTQI